jgi:hypothetical protein
VRAAGFRGAVTTEPGVNPGGEPLETLRRTMIDAGDSLDDVRAKIDGLLDAPSALRTWLQRRRGAEV